MSFVIATMSRSGSGSDGEAEVAVVVVRSAEYAVLINDERSFVVVEVKPLPIGISSAVS